MIHLFALLASSALAAQQLGVFELSVYAKPPEKGQSAHDAISTSVRAAGGIEMLTGPTERAFSFGRGTPVELRQRMLRAIDAMARVAALRGEKERCNPTLDARKEETARELKALGQERQEIDAPLQGTPNLRDLIDRRLQELKTFDPAKEERLEVAAGPAATTPAAPPHK